MRYTDSGKCDVGVAGLGGIGLGIAQNISSHLYQVATCDPRPQKGEALAEGLAADPLLRARTLPELAGMLRQPRIIFLFGETEAPTDAMIDELLPHLTPRDLLIDAGDSHFKDAERRARKLSERSVEFMALGIAGGEEAARQGAMIVAGGGREVYARMRPLLEALATNVKGEPSVGHLGSAAAASFARMVHEGIECGLLQLVSEAFDLMQRTLELSEEQLQDVSGAWRVGALNDYRAEAFGHVFDPLDGGTEPRQMKARLNALKNKPAVQQFAQCARELGVPTPTIDAALGMQRYSARERQRSLILTPCRHPSGRFGDDADSVLDELRGALYAAMIITYAEGFAVLAEASAKHRFRFDPVEIARVWKGGCSVRTELLDDIAGALRATPSLGNLLFDEDLAEKVMTHQECLRHAVWRAGELDTVAPGLLSSLDYLDSLRDAWLPVNLVQVQRDREQRCENRKWAPEETTLGF
ncbi:MAG TPA: NAD(P)-binding domain-containing protein [Candidatus Baltobacteraceae bacterium]|jgi:6-phosphogluconate dehydrogenase|nr:NAD(P)-binding domain-containing protein [Candidatus Baltobacteraceae bacterium]